MIRFVITLDADTRLPRDSARRLVGKMAHPLNRPRFDTPHRARDRRLRGAAAASRTLACPLAAKDRAFQRVFSSASGIDPYAAAISDVYQDLFGEGSYAGKGIYHIDAFEAALAGRVPDDALLSHDLFEGIFARAGLVTDIQVVEEFPSRYDVAAARQHRWARGDWQLLPWILGRTDVAAATGARGSARVPLIGLWKMLDNLRRSLVAPTCVAALVAGWLLPPSAALLWTSLHPGHRCAARVVAGVRCHRAEPCGHHAAQSLLRAAPGHRTGLCADRVPAHLSRSPGLADE